MATSGALSTSNQYIKYTITVTQNSQSVTGNTSNVTVSVRFYRTNTGYTTDGTGTVYCKIDGTTYTAAVTNAQKITSSGIVLFTKTLNISHSSNGSKTLTCSAWISHYAFSASEQSYSQTLTTIPRASGLTASNGTLNTSQTLTISRADSSFKHKIAYSCGSASGYAAGSSSSYTTATSISWTPPLSLASQNTTGTGVSVTLTLYTYTSGGTHIGTVTKTISCAIPATVKPSCTLSVTDPTGCTEKYGNPVKGLSRLAVTVTPATSYGSPIASYSTTVGSARYTAASFTTGVLNAAGSLTVTAAVTDKRGRSGSATVTRNVLDYKPPQLTGLNVRRCNADGTDNQTGQYVQATFSASVTALGNKNTASYTLRYRKTTDTAGSDTEVSFSSLKNTYTVTDYRYVFPAADSSSYYVELVVTDNHSTVRRTTSASTAAVPMHWKASGKGVGIGKLAERDAAEFGMDVYICEDMYVKDSRLADHIVEQGTSGGWYYRKYNSGFVEMFKREMVNLTARRNWGGEHGYLFNAGSRIVVKYPFTLTAVYYNSATVENGSAFIPYLGYPYGSGLELEQFSWEAFTTSPIPVPVTVYANYYSAGRWK